MPRKYAKRFTKRKYPYKRKYTYYSKRSSAVAYRALRIAKNATRKVAGEVNKWQITPEAFANYALSADPSSTTSTIFTQQFPLLNITSGNPWIMPLNWIYTGTGTVSTSVFNIDGQAYNTNTPRPNYTTTPYAFGTNPIWYNTLDPEVNTSDFQGAELQYKMAYIYIKGIFNASSGEETNKDGAVRFVIVKDKQPQAGSATWYDSTRNNVQDRGVFTANLIDAQLNPSTTGRFKIMYDKTIRFTTINGYKPFQYFKKLSTIVRNTRQPIAGGSFLTQLQSPGSAPPVLKNAFYLMIFSDGINFSYSTNSSTPNNGFHMFSRIGYYNN
nr:MAG: capsid protein [Cressdnaviricota sp.]